MSKTKKATPAARRPEKKVGPFHNGIGLAIWLNRVDTADGPRFFRSVTFNCRRLDGEEFVGTATRRPREFEQIAELLVTDEGENFAVFRFGDELLAAALLRPFERGDR